MGGEPDDRPGSPRQASLNRVPGRKSLLPLLCFSKSAVGLYPENSGLESKDSEDDGTAAAELVPAVAGEEAVQVAVVLEEKQDVRVEVVLRSCIRKPANEEDQEQEDSRKDSGKGRVKWMDTLGKELVEIKEYESSHYAEWEDDGAPSCVCSIQ